MYRICVAFLLASFTLPGLASEPGQPLDCSDWVFLEPGLSCSSFAPIGTLTEGHPALRNGESKVVDNQGRLLWLRDVDWYVGGPCSSTAAWDNALCRIELVAFDGVTEQVIAHLADRLVNSCVPGECRADNARLTVGDCSANNGCATSRGALHGSVLAFDAVHGRVLIGLATHCTYTYSHVFSCSDYPDQWWIASITGFATLYEISQSYDPASSASGFRVPVMPEGLPAADYFDTYYGEIGNYDFTEAQPLQCGYPPTAPSVGDYLTVEDPLPTPSSGQGRWYLTAVTYQGEKRYGRKAVGGVLSGRDPAAFPGCMQALSGD